MNLEKKISSKPFLKNVSKLLSANLIVQIIAFSLSPIITRLYDAKDFGQLAIFMSIAGFFIILASLRFEYAIILPQKEENANALVQISLAFSLLVSFLSFLFVYFFKNAIENYHHTQITTLWIFLIPLVVFFSSSFTVLLNYYNRQKKYNQQAVSQGVLGVSNPLTSIVLALKTNVQYGLIHAVFISNFLASIFLFPLLFKNKVLKIKANLKTVFKSYYRFPLYNLPHALLNFISVSLPVFILTPAFGEITIGLFTMAVGKVFKPVNLLGNSIYQVLSKKIVDDIHHKKTVFKHVLKLVNTMFLIGIIPFLILFIFAPQIFSFIWGADWYQAGLYIRYLLPWLFMVYLTATLSFIPNVFEKQKEALIIEIVHLIVRLVVLLIGVKYHDIYLALTLYSLGSFVVLLFSLFWYLYVVKQSDKSIEKEKT